MGVVIAVTVSCQGEGFSTVGLVVLRSGGSMLPVFAGLMTAAGLVLAGQAVVGRRRNTTAGLSLAVLLVSVAWWGLAYGVELSVSDLAAKLPGVACRVARIALLRVRYETDRS
jgi:hypothetical protein